MPKGGKKSPKVKSGNISGYLTRHRSKQTANSSINISVQESDKNNMADASRQSVTPSIEIEETQRKSADSVENAPP